VTDAAAPRLVAWGMPLGPLLANAYLIGDESTREAVVVDPGQDPGPFVARLRDEGWRVRGLVCTHAHFDHIGGAARLKHVTGAPVFMHADDQDQYDHLNLQAQWLGMPAPPRTEVDANPKEGDTLTLGGVAMHVLHTPGHTQGSVALYIPAEGLLIGGDTLFRDSIGRTDLPGGDAKQILKSIRTKLLVLPEETRVICGHGPETTIGREKELNPFLRD